MAGDALHKHCARNCTLHIMVCWRASRHHAISVSSPSSSSRPSRSQFAQGTAEAVEAADDEEEGGVRTALRRTATNSSSQAAALPRGAWGMRAARGRAVGGPWEGRAGGSLAMAPTPSPKCHLPLAPDGGKPDFSVQGAGAAWSSTPCRVAPSGAGSTAHRGLGRTRPSAARVGRAGGDRKVRRRLVGSE